MSRAGSYSSWQNIDPDTFDISPGTAAGPTQGTGATQGTDSTMGTDPTQGTDPSQGTHPTQGTDPTQGTSPTQGADAVEPDAEPALVLDTIVVRSESPDVSVLDSDVEVITNPGAPWAPWASDGAHVAIPVPADEDDPVTEGIDLTDARDDIDASEISSVVTEELWPSNGPSWAPLIGNEFIQTVMANACAAADAQGTDRGTAGTEPPQGTEWRAPSPPTSTHTYSGAPPIAPPMESLDARAPVVASVRTAAASPPLEVKPCQYTDIRSKQ